MMKKILLLLPLTITFVMADSKFSYGIILEKDAVFQGTTFLKGTEIQLSTDGQIFKVILGIDQKICDQTFKESFPHVLKKGSILNYTSYFGDKPMMPLPTSILTVEGQEIFSHQIPANCKLEPSYMILTSGGRVEYSIDHIQIKCPADFKILNKMIQKDKEIQIHSKSKVTFYNDEYKIEEIK